MTDPAGFLADVEAAPARLAALAESLRRTDPWAFVDPGRVDRVLLLGMGSSRYAAAVAARRMRARDVVAVAEVATTPSWPPSPGLLPVAVSATGGSAETLVAAEPYAGRGLTALTENPESELAAMAGAVVPLQAGPEAGGVACRSFRHTLVLLLALAERLAPGAAPDLPDVADRAAEATADLLDRRGGWLAELADRLDGPDGVAVIAPGERLSSAQQSALMMREGPRRPAVASETGDWAHVDVYLAKTLDYRALLLPGSRWDDQAMEWLRLRESTVLPVGAEVPGALPALRYRHDHDPDVRLLAEVTVAELVARRWWGSGG